MALFYYPFLALATAGLFAVFGIHLAALLGATYPFEHFVMILGPGVFIVWLPTMLVSFRMTRNVKQRDFWRAALRGCPKWMQRVLWILAGYSWIGFFALPLIYGGGMEASANKARSMSDVLLIFYAIAACVLYSAIQLEKPGKDSFCVNGHRISPLAKHCEECGAPARAKFNPQNLI